MARSRRRIVPRSSSVPSTEAARAGRSAIVAMWQRAMSAFEFVGFFASAGPLTVNGATASGTWYQQEFLHQKDGARRAVTGCYRDEYVKRGGRWYFSKRVYTVLKAEAS